jgi:mannose-6-phosphate isomerase-like protein (cupin superfamily)
MKRNKFILSALALAVTPFAAFAEIKNKLKRFGKGFKVEAGKDRFDSAITLMEGDTFYTKISTKDSDGDIFVFESTRVVNGGPPLHYHYEQDEWFYILQGEFLFKIGDETFTLKAGDSAFGPRMIPHAFAKTNDGIAKMLITFQPAGKMEMHFKEVSQGLYKKMSDKEKQAIRQQHGFEVVGPALTHEK